jgi:hypothetical protein
MKKPIVAIFMLLALACAEVSQDAASSICNAYGMDGESIQVSGPMSCEGEYWICEFSYFGNPQNVVIAISRSSGAVLGASSDILEDIVRVSYAAGKGRASLHNTLLNDAAFAIELNGMNSTLHNYGEILKTLNDEKHISQPEYAELRSRLTPLRLLTSELAEASNSLNELSRDFLAYPDCVVLIDYIERMEYAITLAENFSESWLGFIEKYNSMAGSVEGVYVAAINPSSAQIISQSIISIKAGFEQYVEDSESNVRTILSNLQSRLLRKEARDELNAAYNILSVSGNNEAAIKYNEARTAFSEGKYQDAKRLAREASALARVTKPDEEPVVIIEATPDYSIYFIAVVVLAGAILLISLKGRIGGEEKEEGEEEERKSKGKPAKKGSWAFVRERGSSMQKSEGLLDS